MKVIDFFGLSFIGKRVTNQDHFTAVKLNSDTLFFGVADGMGGAAGGEIASRLVIDSAIAFMKEQVDQGVQENTIKNILEETFKKCQEAIASQLVKTPELEGMGSTFSCLLIYKDYYVYGSIGDSRIYRIGKNRFDQISKDHSLIQDYKDKFGNNIPDAISNQSNIITRVIDGRGDLPDIYPLKDNYVRFQTHDAFIICSDGLLLNKSENQETSLFYKYMVGCRNLEECCKQLVSYAYQSGSSDNITLVAITIGKLQRKKVKIQKFIYPPASSQSGQIKINSKRKRKPIRTFLFLCGLIFLIGGGAFLTLNYLISPPDQQKSVDVPDTPKDSPYLPSIIKLKGFLNNNPTTPVDLSSYLLEWDVPANPEKIDGFLISVLVNGKTRKEVPVAASQNSIKLKNLMGGLHSKDKVSITLKSKSKCITIENRTIQLEIQ